MVVQGPTLALSVGKCGFRALLETEGILSSFPPPAVLEVGVSLTEDDIKF